MDLIVIGIKRRAIPTYLTTYEGFFTIGHPWLTLKISYLRANLLRIIYYGPSMAYIKNLGTFLHGLL